MSPFTHHFWAYLFLPVGGSKQSKVTKAFNAYQVGKDKLREYKKCRDLLDII